MKDGGKFSTMNIKFITMAAAGMTYRWKLSRLRAGWIKVAYLNSECKTIGHSNNVE